MRSILLLGCLFLLFSLSQVKSLLSIFEDRDDLSTKIDRLEKFYEREPSVEVAGNLALLYQEMDNRHSGTPLWHDKSLELFNTAIQGAQSAIPPIVSQHVLYVWVIQRAILYISMGKSAAALADLETALTLASTPRDISECLYHRGASFMLAGRVRDAMEAYRESLDLAPEQLSTYHVICVCHKSLKDLDQAGWCELEEEIAAALLRRTQARGVPAELRLVPLAQTHEHQESGVYWALHEAAEGCGAYGRAWEHLMQAHAVERASREEMKLQHPEVDFFYNATRSRYAAKWRMSTYTKDFFPPPQLNFGVDSLVPVFIVGLPRSGSTLLESFLDSHKDVSTVGENSLFGLGVSGLPEDEQRIMTEYFEKVRDRMRQERERKVNLTLNDNMATAAILTTGGVSIDLGAAYDKGEEGDRTEDIFNATQLSPNSTAESEYTAAWRETIKARALDIISNMTAYALKNTDEVQFRSSRSHSPSVGGAAEAQAHSRQNAHELQKFGFNPSVIPQSCHFAHGEGPLGQRRLPLETQLRRQVFRLDSRSGPGCARVPQLLGSNAALSQRASSR